MGTRGNVVIKDEFDVLWFYCHGGPPESVAKTLNKFMEWLRAGKIRGNASQSAGWLILLGARDYDTIYTPGEGEKKKKLEDFFEPVQDGGMFDWKVGRYEPTGGRHGDIEFLYIIDVVEMTLTAYEAGYEEDKDIWTKTNKKGLPQPGDTKINMKDYMPDAK